MAHAVDRIVDRCIFFYIGIRLRKIRFRLIVIVIADEIVNRVMGKKPLKFVKELGGQRLVVHHHQRRPLDVGDHAGQCEGLSRAGHPQQHLVRVPGTETIDKAIDRRPLVPPRFKGCD